MATNFKYASQSDLKNYFNNFSNFDQKTQIYNWVKQADLTAGGASTDDIDLYYSQNCGYINQLYFNGVEMSSFTKTQVALLNGAIESTQAVITLDASHGVEAGDIVKIGNEYLYATNVSTNDVTFIRGVFNTQPVDVADDTAVYLVIDLSEYPATTATSASNTPLFYYYDSDLDLVFMIVDGEATGGSDPSQNVVENGIDFNTFADQQLVNASMELNNLLDARFQMPLPKSTQIKEGAASGLTPEYDPVIIKSTCYICAANLIRSKDVMSEEAQMYMDMVTNLDGTGLVDKINDGKIKLSFEVDNKDSQGSIREITRTGSMYLVETAGEFYGGENGYDLLRITCTTAGAYGTAKCKVEYYGNDKLFGSDTTNNIVTGALDDWKGLDGLLLRFQGASMAENDQWEIEAYNEAMEETNSVTRNISLHR